MANWLNGVKEWSKSILLPEKPIDQQLSEINAEARSKTYTLSELKSWSEIVGGNYSMSNSGIAVDQNSSLGLISVYSCINIIAETAATLPFNRMEIKDGKKSISDKSTIDNLFLTNPNPFQTWFDFKYHLVKEALSNGNGYALIERDYYGNPIALQPLSSYEVQPFYHRDGISHLLYYWIHGQQTRRENVIHIKCLGSNGVVGYSPIQIAREAIGAGLAQQDFTGSLYRNGLNLQGVMEHPASLSNEAAVRLKRQMDDFRGSRNASGTIVLEEGLTYKSITIPPKDVEFVASKRFTNEEIARLYRVPLHKIGELSRSTNNNIEQQALEFYTDTMSPWLERIEQEFDMKLTFQSEKRRIKHEFDAKKLLRMDSKGRSEYLRTLFNLGAKTPNQIRQDEGENAIDDEAMDKYYLQLNMSEIGKVNEGSRENIPNQNREEV